MAINLYWLGVLLALLAGSITQLGSVFQKKAVNQTNQETKFMRNLVKNPTWILGVVLSFGISSIFFLTAQALIGPALIPGLMSIGLVVLVIGSIKLVGERLKIEEYIGILLMIFGTIFLSLSQLSIEIIEIDLLEIGLVIRITVYTVILVVISLICYFFQKRNNQFKGIFLALLSGFMFALSNLWVSQLIGTITEAFNDLAQLFMSIIAGIILIFTSIYGLATIQQAFKVGQASNLIPVQNVPVLISPIIIYFFVFLMIPPFILSIPFLIIGIGLIIVSFFLLGKRSAQMEEIK